LKKTSTHNADDRAFMEQDDFADEMSSPIGRLMSDESDEEPAEEPNAFVSGFARSQPEEAPAPIERRPRRERPVSPSSDEDFFEAGIREARASKDRDRRRRPNPDPRPAMRAGTPTSKRMASPPPSRRREQEFNLPDAPPEDQYDTFRQRYNPDELISTTRGMRPVRRGAAQQREEIDLSASRGFASRFADDEGERTSLVRWVAFAGVIVVLGFIIILATGRSRALRDYREVRYQVTGMEAAYARYNSLVWENEAMAIQIESLQDDIRELEAQLRQLTTPDTPGITRPADNGDDNGTTDAPPAQGNFPATHVVESGQTLSSIARLFYGPATDSEVQLRANRIAAYNNIADPSLIRVGDVLTIPALP